MTFTIQYIAIFYILLPQSLVNNYQFPPSNRSESQQESAVLDSIDKSFQKLSQNTAKNDQKNTQSTDVSTQYSWDGKIKNKNREVRDKESSSQTGAHLNGLPKLTNQLLKDNNNTAASKFDTKEINKQNTQSQKSSRNENEYESYPDLQNWMKLDHQVQGADQDSLTNNINEGLFPNVDLEDNFADQQLYPYNISQDENQFMQQQYQQEFQEQIRQFNNLKQRGWLGSNQLYDFQNSNGNNNANKQGVYSQNSNRFQQQQQYLYDTQWSQQQKQQEFLNHAQVFLDAFQREIQRVQRSTVLSISIIRIRIKDIFPNVTYAVIGRLHQDGENQDIFPIVFDDASRQLIPKMNIPLGIGSLSYHVSTQYASIFIRNCGQHDKYFTDTYYMKLYLNLYSVCCVPIFNNVLIQGYLLVGFDSPQQWNEIQKEVMIGFANIIGMNNLDFLTQQDQYSNALFDYNQLDDNTQNYQSNLNYTSLQNQSKLHSGNSNSQQSAQQQPLNEQQLRNYDSQGYKSMRGLQTQLGSQSQNDNYNKYNQQGQRQGPIQHASTLDDNQIQKANLNSNNHHYRNNGDQRAIYNDSSGRGRLQQSKQEMFNDFKEFQNDSQLRHLDGQPYQEAQQNGMRMELPVSEKNSVGDNDLNIENTFTGKDSIYDKDLRQIMENTPKINRQQDLSSQIQAQEQYFNQLNNLPQIKEEATNTQNLMSNQSFKQNNETREVTSQAAARHKNSLLDQFLGEEPILKDHLHNGDLNILSVNDDKRIFSQPSEQVQKLTQLALQQRQLKKGIKKNKSKRTSISLRSEDLSFKDQTQRQVFRDPRKTGELDIQSIIGSGGFGNVYKGKWRNIQVAIKVMQLGDEFQGFDDELSNSNDSQQNQVTSGKRAALLEGAMMRSIKHINIVRTYDYCIIDNSEVTQQLMVIPHQSSMTQTYIIMEYMDMGSLSEAIDEGVFHGHNPKLKVKEKKGRKKLNRQDANQTNENGDKSVNVEALLLSLLDVSRAMAYLHKIGIMHRDLKPKNVLLKSNTNDSRGFTAKISDFGLSQFQVDQNVTHLSTRYSGTVTHMPPELLEEGRVYPAGDVYAFAIIAWEMYTMMSPYKDLSRPQIVVGVVSHDLRPTIPPHMPPWYKDLLVQSWHKDPHKRPKFSQIVVKLEEMLAQRGWENEDGQWFDKSLGQNDQEISNKFRTNNLVINQNMTPLM